MKKLIKQKNDKERRKRQEQRRRKAAEKKQQGATSYDFYDDDDNDLFVADDDEYTKGYGIKSIETFTGVPLIDPKKMLIKLNVLLSRIYAGYSSKEIIKETKRVLDSLYNSRLITDTVYNHLASL